ncbi:olfactory receptor 2K2-like protein, partial [Lates japonicus]
PHRSSWWLPYTTSYGLPFFLALNYIVVLGNGGLSMTWSVSTGIFVIIAFSYFRIPRGLQNKVETAVSAVRPFRHVLLHLVVTVQLWMENVTTLTPLKQPIVFELEGFHIPPGYGSFLFFLALLNYIVVLLGNGVVVCVIVIDKNLHRPMFVMAFSVHTYGVAVQTILAAMAYDRTVQLWMENVTTLTPLKQPIVFELEGFHIPPGYGSFLFFLALLNYIVVLLGNGVVVCVIVIDKNLHRPIVGRIAYIPAIAQAFSVHTYGVAVQTILAAMAYDSSAALLPALPGFVAVLCIAVLFGFHMNVPLCGNIIKHVYSSNRAILSLACRSTPTNNIYGLSMTWSVSTGIFVIIAFSYFRILHASVKQSGDSGVRSKAFQT